jgi:hypothetical protein
LIISSGVTLQYLLACEIVSIFIQSLSSPGILKGTLSGAFKDYSEKSPLSSIFEMPEKDESFNRPYCDY